MSGSGADPTYGTHRPLYDVMAMEDRTDWLDEISSEQYRWTRPTPTLLETMLRPDLPCRIRLGAVGALPVLYVAIGTNGTVNYWQWATLDGRTSKPLPKEKALSSLWKVIDLALITSKSRVVPKLLSA